MSSSLQQLRDQIDRIDSEILDLLQERFDVTAQVGELKSRTKQSVLQKGRWQDILEKLKDGAEQRGLSYEMLQRIWDTMHDESQKQESIIVDNNAKK
jgi:chorismate mutase